MDPVADRVTPLIPYLRKARRAFAHVGGCLVPLGLVPRDVTVTEVVVVDATHDPPTLQVVRRASSPPRVARVARHSNRSTPVPIPSVFVDDGK